MTNEEIYKKWTGFINDPKYNKYLLSNEELWMYQLKEVKKYIDTNNKKPSARDKNNNTKTLSNWISHQHPNYKKKEYIMSNEEIYKQWTDFINDPKYKKYF
jgi:hypothetical protein